MLLENTLADYAAQEVEIMGARITEIMDTLKETDAMMESEIKNPSEPDEGDNVIHVDFRPFSQFYALKKVVVPLHELIKIYSDWNDTLWELAHANKGQYKHPNLVLFLAKLRYVVGTFGSFFDESS